MNTHALPLIALIDDDTRPIVEVAIVRGDTKEQRFRTFHEANPHVYRQIVAISRNAVERGASRLSIKAIFEQLRARIETHGALYRLDNSLTAYYARLVMEREPGLRGLFETRRSQSDPDYYQREARA